MSYVVAGSTTYPTTKDNIDSLINEYKSENLSPFVVNVLGNKKLPDRNVILRDYITETTKTETTETETDADDTFLFQFEKKRHNTPVDAFVDYFEIDQ